MKYSIELSKVTKEYNDGASLVTALKGVDLQIKLGEDAVIMGPSGSGKSTLLQLIGALDTATSGTIRVAGQEVVSMSDASAAAFRNETIGFIFQSFYLQPYQSAIENVMLPLLLAGKTEDEARDRAQKLLKKVGLHDRANHDPSQLSGGEMQRVAIARALVNEPTIVLADEPTGNLDKDNAQKILALFKKLSTKKVSFIIVTHDEQVADEYSRVIKIRDGEIL